MAAKQQRPCQRPAGGCLASDLQVAVLQSILEHYALGALLLVFE
jgi:hypothetical protein